MLGLSSCARPPIARSQNAAAAQACARPTGRQVRFTTLGGAFTIELDGARAPLSTANFLQYVRDGHYDGTIFHRVIGNFMVQGGGFRHDGTEKPVARRRAERIRQRAQQSSRHGRDGAHGRSAQRTSQFYVNVVDNHALDPSPSRWGYAVFGRVVEGMDTIDKISSVATGQLGPFPEDAPLQPVVIESAQVVGDPAPPSEVDRRKTLFISDLHLDPAVARRSRGNCSSFSRRRRARRGPLYILGDLFEAWLGDDDPDPAVREIVAALRD